MYYAFRLSAQRKVEEANYNTYVNPSPHPDRVMAQHDFLYILDGKWEIALELEGKPRFFQIQRGDLLILPAGLHHYGASLCSPNSRNMYIHVEAMPEDHLESRRENDNTQDDFVLLPTLTHCGDNIEISKYFSEIIAGYWRNVKHREKRLSCLFELLLYELGDQQLKTPVDSQCFAFVHKIVRFVQANPETFFSVSEIAMRFSVSEKTLNKRFKKVYDKTFYAWQMDQKLDMVYQYLHSTAGITLKETAVNFGFYDEFHLSRAFKKKFGAAPKYVR